MEVDGQQHREVERRAAEQQGLAAVTDALAATRITEGPPFEDICPIAYDGMEVTYGVPEGSVSNCDLLVDASDPLVEILDDLAAEARRGAETWPLR